MVVANKAELIAEQLLSGNINKKTWADIIHNANVYGARPENSAAVNTPLIQKAIDAAKGTSNLVFIPSGVNYDVSGLSVPSGVILWDESSGYSIRDLAAGAQKNSIEIARDANYSGGQQGWVNSAIYSVTTVREGATSFEWGITSVMNNYSSGGGENVGIYGQGNVYADNTKTWGGVMEARDRFPGGSTQGWTVGLEVDLFTNGEDNSNRIVLDVVVGKHDQAGLTPNVHAGIRVAPQGGFLDAGEFKSAILIEGKSTRAINIMGQNLVGIDLSTGTNSDSAIRIKGGDAIALNEFSDIKMKYNPSTGFIEFYNGGVRKGYIDVGAAGTDHAL